MLTCGATHSVYLGAGKGMGGSNGLSDTKSKSRISEGAVRELVTRRLLPNLPTHNNLTSLIGDPL